MKLSNQFFWTSMISYFDKRHLPLRTPVYKDIDGVNIPPVQNIDLIPYIGGPKYCFLKHIHTVPTDMKYRENLTYSTGCFYRYRQILFDDSKTIIVTSPIFRTS